MREARSGSIAILYPAGHLCQPESVSDLEATLNRLLADGCQQVIINMADVLHMNSTGLGAIMTAHIRYSKQPNHRLALCALTPHLENIFVITKLALVIDLYPSEESALASFAQPPM